MIMLGRLDGIDPPVARHAEVKDENVAAVSLDKAIFRTAAKADDPGTHEALAQVQRESAPQVWPPRLDPLDAAALEHMSKTAHGRLDFG
jgi:hypothetical protein